MPQTACVFVAILLVGALASSTYTLVKHPIETGARCLDGSPAALYYSLGSGVNINKFLIYFEGGGVCSGANLTSTLDSCYKRSLTDLGSSNKYSETRDLPYSGALSGTSTANPVFYDWTRVIIQYCDGVEHMGTRQIPVNYKGADLYFRGTNNTITHLDFLNTKFGLFNADQIVVTGISAGGQATYYWSNYVYDRSNNKQVFAFPDSGLFLISYVNPFSGHPLKDYLVNLFKLMDTDVDLPMPECKTQFADPMECYSANKIAKYIKTPIFIVESQYDMWSLHNILQLSCMGSKTLGTLANCSAVEVTAIQNYRTALLSALKDFNVNSKIGIWAPSCIQHGFITNSFTNSAYEIPARSGTTIANAIKKFLDNPGSGDHIYMDVQGWPSNAGCSGITDRLHLLRHQE